MILLQYQVCSYKSTLSLPFLAFLSCQVSTRLIQSCCFTESHTSTTGSSTWSGLQLSPLQAGGTTAKRSLWSQQPKVSPWIWKGVTWWGEGDCSVSTAPWELNRPSNTASAFSKEARTLCIVTLKKYIKNWFNFFLHIIIFLFPFPSSVSPWFCPLALINCYDTSAVGVVLLLKPLTDSLMN